MPRYFFHVRSAGTLSKDEEGIEFPALADAIEDAVRSAANFVVETEASQAVPADTVIQVADETGTVLCDVPVLGRGH